MATTVATEPRVEPTPRRRIVDRLFAPTDVAILAYFRIVFGVIIAWDGIHAFQEYRVESITSATVLFKFWPFDWVKPLPAPLLNGVYVLMIVAGLFMAVGLYYRAAAIAIWATVTYVFFLDAAEFLNHMYLVGLIAFLMIFVPANRKWALDARFDPSLRSETVPAWTLWILLFQVAVPYFYGGIAKLSTDWYRGEPLRSFLLTKKDFPLIGHYFGNAAVLDLFIWGTLLLDLLVVFFLLSRRTRVFAFAVALTFHLINSRLFHIGIFPWTMICATALFFPPDWPRRLVSDFRASTKPPRFWRFVIGFVIVGAIAAYIPRVFSVIHVLVGGLGGGLVGYFIDEPWHRTASTTPLPAADAVQTEVSPTRKRLTVWLLAAYVAFQLLFPLRGFLIPGNVYWTEEGQRFAWHMMLRHRSGTAKFVVRDPRNGATRWVDPIDFLNERQMAVMPSSPDMTVQFAHYLHDLARREWHIPDAEVRVRDMISLNDRSEQVYIDPTVNLARVNRPWFGHKSWILPLEPLKKGEHRTPSKTELDRDASSSTG